MTISRRKKSVSAPKRAPGAIAPNHQRPVGDLAAGPATLPQGYASWLAEVKARVQAAQQRASLLGSRGKEDLHRESSTFIRARTVSISMPSPGL